jgi:hypothetical protein
MDSAGVEAQCEAAMRNSDNDANLQPIAGSSNSEQVEPSKDLRIQNSNSCLERFIPQIIVTRAEDLVGSTGRRDLAGK